MRSLAFNAAYWILSIGYTLAAVIAALVPGRAATGWIIRGYVRRMVQALRVLAGIRIQYRGEDRLPAGAFILAAKHQSWGDGFSVYDRFDDLAFVTGKSWSGYNYYQGGYHSKIEVNTDLPIRISRAVDLGCHEGYPGHHVYNALLEKHLVRDRGWKEFTVYPLFSPQSLIAEGTANYGIEVAFPGADRVEF